MTPEQLRQIRMSGQRPDGGFIFLFSEGFPAQYDPQHIRIGAQSLKADWSGVFGLDVFLWVKRLDTWTVKLCERINACKPKTLFLHDPVSGQQTAPDAIAIHVSDWDYARDFYERKQWNDKFHSAAERGAAFLDDMTAQEKWGMH